MILLRSSAHNNGVFVLWDKETNSIIKSSANLASVHRLKNEYKGYRWYYRQLQSEDAKILKIDLRPRDVYARLQLTFIEGHTVPYFHQIHRNEPYILKAIDYYCSIWPTTGATAMHGDFSLGNIIWAGDKINIIDWEHFALKLAPWGFDAVNMLYEALYFSMKGDKISDKDAESFTRLRSNLRTQIPRNGFQPNIKGLMKFLDSNHRHWGDMLNKLPVMKFSEQQIKKIAQLE